MSHQPLFYDRRDAGQRLAQAIVTELSQLRLVAKPVVYALPRGGLPVAEPIAELLHCPLDVLVAKKITLPDNPELAIGAVSATGQVMRSRQQPFTQELGTWRTALQRAYAKAQEQLEALQPYRPQVSPQGAIAILVDDGIATGMTIAVAARAMQAERPAAVWICAPVAPEGMMSVLAHWSDRNIFLATPASFLSVSRFYEEFDQVKMAAAIACLKRQNQNLC